MPSPKGHCKLRKTERRTSTHKQCTWIMKGGTRCTNNAVGHYFCEQHFKQAGELECMPDYGGIVVDHVIKGLESNKSGFSDMAITPIDARPYAYQRRG